VKTGRVTLVPRVSQACEKSSSLPRSFSCHSFWCCWCCRKGGAPAAGNCLSRCFSCGQRYEIIPEKCRLIICRMINLYIDFFSMLFESGRTWLFPGVFWSFFFQEGGKKKKKQKQSLGCWWGLVWDWRGNSLWDRVDEFRGNFVSTHSKVFTPSKT
jgi:hypothetical protein